MKNSSFSFTGEVLLGVKHQLNHTDFQKVFAILCKSESIFAAPIRRMIGLIDNEIERAQDNVRYLKLVIEPCNDLASVESPSDIPTKLPCIINTIRFIWLNSGYYTSPDAITKLYRYVGNQIIEFCRKKINVAAIFTGDASNQIKLANMSIDCCLYYKVIYQKIAQMPSDAAWQLDEPMIFNHIDSFVNRLHDFIEICRGIIIFSRKTSTENFPNLQFGSDRGAEFESVCAHVESAFEDGIVKIKRNSSNILNINKKDWPKNMRSFSEMTSNLEEIIDNLIVNVFTRIENMEDGIYALACLQRFSTREKLHKSFDRKVETLWNRFNDELSVTNVQVIQDDKERLSYLPKMAGQMVQSKVNRMRLIRLRSLLEQNEWMPDSIDTPKILSEYKTMIAKMEKGTQQLFDEWVQSLGVDIASKLNRLLLRRSLTHSGLFECNMDESVFAIFREARFFQMLGCGFPVHLSQFFSRERSIRLIYDGIVEMVASYNRILMSLSETERTLLRPLTQKCDKCIAPGALKLIWANEGLDIYISDCNKGIRDLSDFIRIYQHTNAKIVSTAERLCEIVAINIPKDQPRQLHEIEQMVQQYLDKQSKLISIEIDSVCKSIVAIRREMEDVDSVSKNDEYLILSTRWS